MTDPYGQLVERLSDRCGLGVHQIERMVEARRAQSWRLLGKATAVWLVAAHTRLTQYLGARHVTGLDIAHAVAAATVEAHRGHLSTLGYWPHPRETPALLAEEHLRAIDAIAESHLPSSISIKAERLGCDRHAVLRVLRHAIPRRVRVHFDAETQHSVDSILALVEEGLTLGADVSVTLPSRWQRSSADAEQIVRLRIPCRIVKGQGRDPAHPRIDPRRSFVDLVEQVAGRAAHVAIATHDRRVAGPALDRLLATQTPCSLEQLRSLPRLDALAAARGVPIRVYVAYGRSGLPYALTQILGRPAIIGWVLRDLLVRPRHRVAA
jgi:proline dehydrogenase